jgi:hypothetical protein
VSGIERHLSRTACLVRAWAVARMAVHDLAGRAIIHANPEPLTVEATPTRS